ncbi:NAD-dependent epimerase/dehydratase terH like protein [Verticillium longisporum]|nr:NAD-dependent epimerase/dehydratase terH like protein [Verticillium longisporum]
MFPRRKPGNAEGAFDEAVKGVSAIAHIATISTLDPDPNNVVPQTVAGTVSILQAALTEPSVQRVIYTSTLLTSTFPAPGNDIQVKRHTWNDAAVEAAWAPPPYLSSRSMLTYTASEVAAEKEFWKFAEERDPHFTINVVSPASITGEPLHPKHADSPVYWVKPLYKGDKTALEIFQSSFFVDVKDIALLHVAAILDPDIKNARLQAWGHSQHWNDLLAVLRNLRPQEEFIPDYPDRSLLTISTDFSD